MSAEQEIEKNVWTWIAFSKDTMAFQCDECLSAELFWIRIMSTGKAEVVRLLEEFIVQQELDKDMNYQVQTWDEVSM